MKTVENYKMYYIDIGTIACLPLMLHCINNIFHINHKHDSACSQNKKKCKSDKFLRTYAVVIQVTAYVKA